MREAVIERNTKETQIQVKVVLDGKALQIFIPALAFLTTC